MQSVTQRNLAIDVLRGLTLALMVVVNMAFDDERSYGQLQHSVWNGFTLTDAVFPAFLFAVGASLALVIDRQRAAGEAVFRHHVLRRCLALAAIGYLLSWLPFYRFDDAGSMHWIDLAHTRIPGVLQRIAVTYALTALIAQRFGSRGAAVTALLALMAYPLLLAVGGDLSLEGSGERALDLWLMGANHLYHGEGIAFDPEGILSTLPALANVCAGFLAGRWLRYPMRHRHAWLAAVGLLALLMSLLWSLDLPYNKKLWTSSYALLNIGLDAMLLAALGAAINERGLRRGTEFFAILGRNALAVYVFSELGNLLISSTRIGTTTTYVWLHAHLFAPWAGDRLGSLLYSLAYLALCWLFAAALHRRRIYVRL